MNPVMNDEALAHLEFMTNCLPPLKSFNVESMRERMELTAEKTNKKLSNTFNGTEKETFIPIPSREKIPITISTPTKVNNNKLVIFFHGGGICMGSRKTHQTIVNLLAESTQTIWCSVEYRLSPEYKYPVWLDDCLEVTKYILKYKTWFGAEESTKVGVAGDSGGGTIAASICHTLKSIDFQILVCPIIDFDGQSSSHKQFIDSQYLITPELRKWFHKNAFRDENDIRDSRVSLLLQSSFNNLPPCLFIVAELDAVRDDSYVAIDAPEYQKLLDKAGVKTQLVLIQGVLHSFFNLPGIPFTLFYSESIPHILSGISKEYIQDLVNKL